MAAPNMDYEVDLENNMGCKLILPDGKVKEHFSVKIDTTVRKEKERIYRECDIHEPPQNEAVLVLISNENGKETEMIDREEMKNYKDDICKSQIRVAAKRDLKLNPGRNRSSGFLSRLGIKGK